MTLIETYRLVDVLVDMLVDILVAAHQPTKLTTLEVE